MLAESEEGAPELPPAGDPAQPGGASPSGGLACGGAALAVAVFVAFCAVVLAFPQRLGVEPDDGAYRASIVAMTDGHPLTLSATEGRPRRPSRRRAGTAAEPMDRAALQAVHQREESRLPVPRGTVPSARRHPAGPVVLRRAGLPRTV